jgi:hypothetical protein
MKIRVLALGLAWAALVVGQPKHHTNWQDLCFNNPGAPVCQGSGYAIKPPPGTKKDGSKSAIKHPNTQSPRTGTPSMVTVGSIDWRFADPFADALVGIDFSELSDSPLVRSMIAQLGTNQGLNAADMQKIFDGLAGVDQVALSVRANRMVVMITGRVTESNLPPPEAGLKLVPLPGGAILVGHADAVDQAAQRIAMNAPLSELARWAGEQQANSDFWAAGTAALVGPQAISTGVKRFSLTVSLGDGLSSDVAFEFNGAPNATALQAWQKTLGGGTLEGNTIHLRTSLEAGDVQQKFNEIAASALGSQLGALVQSAKYLPVPEATRPKQTRAVILNQ